MGKYKIAWLPDNGIGKDVMDAAKIIFDRLNFDTEHLYGDIFLQNQLKERLL